MITLILYIQFFIYSLCFPRMKGVYKCKCIFYINFLGFSRIKYENGCYFVTSEKREIIKSI